jgi:hypothetical protein
MRVGVGSWIARACAGAVLLVGCARPQAAQSQAAEGPCLAVASGRTSPATEPAAWRPPKSAACEGGDLWNAGPASSCNDVCQAESIVVSRCIDFRRTELVLQAPCECGPARLGAELSGCRWGQMSVVPREAIPASTPATVPADGCKLSLECAPGKLSVVCDGEEDGTGTSLCDCYLDGRPLPLPKPKVWPGEGANTCHAAAAACLKAAL